MALRCLRVWEPLTCSEWGIGVSWRFPLFCVRPPDRGLGSEVALPRGLGLSTEVMGPCFAKPCRWQGLPTAPAPPHTHTSMAEEA